LAKERGRSRCTFRFGLIRWRTERDRKRENARRSIANAGRFLFGISLMPRSAMRGAFGAAARKPSEME
jgi:hypothetical protein